MELQDSIISSLNRRYGKLQAEKIGLKDRVRILEEDVKVIKIAAHLKIKHDLFKKFEQHGGDELDLQAVYDA